MAYLHITTQQPNHTLDTSDQNKYRKVVFLVLGISLLLQTIAIAAPGWIYTSDEGSTTEIGIFYYKLCSKGSTCKTVNVIKEYNTAIGNAETSTELTMQSRFLETVLKEIVGVLLAWLFTSICIVLSRNVVKKGQIIFYSWFVQAVVLSVSGIIMGELVYLGLVRTENLVRRSKLPRYDTMTVTFPYCLFFYAIACFLEFFAAVLIFQCFVDEINKIIGPKIEQPRNAEGTNWRNSSVHEQSF